MPRLTRQPGTPLTRYEPCSTLYRRADFGLVLVTWKGNQMARMFEMSAPRRAANWTIARMLGLGLPLANSYLLTVPGRKTGTPHTTPVTLVEHDGRRYLVAPYGEVDWVRNARAAGKVTLSRGRVREHVAITELSPEQAAPVLRQYINEVPVVRPYFDADKDSSLAHFEAEAPRKPVFLLGEPV